MCCLCARCISKKMERFYFQPLLQLILLIVVSESRAASPGTVTVSGYQEEDVALSCLNPNVTGAESRYRVKWKKYVTNTSRTEVIFMWPKKPEGAKRVRWEADGDGRGCLYLSKLQKSDEGLYSWEIWQGWEMVLVKNISLKVKDCKALPPVTAAPSASVQLNCPVNVTSGWQNVSWAIQKGNSHVSVDSRRAQINGTSLVFQSVTTRDSGWYRCSHTVGGTQRCLVTNLQVQEVRNIAVPTTVPLIATTTQPAATARDVASTNRMEEGNGALIALVAPVVLGVVIAAALAGLFLYRRSKAQSITYRDHTAALRSLTESMVGYECVNLAGSQDPAIMRPNSLYQDQDDSMHTFHY